MRRYAAPCLGRRVEPSVFDVGRGADELRPPSGGFSPGATGEFLNVMWLARCGSIKYVQIDVTHLKLSTLSCPDK